MDEFESEFDDEDFSEEEEPVLVDSSIAQEVFGNEDQVHLQNTEHSEIIHELRKADKYVERRIIESGKPLSDFKNIDSFDMESGILYNLNHGLLKRV